MTNYVLLYSFKPKQTNELKQLRGYFAEIGKWRKNTTIYLIQDIFFQKRTVQTKQKFYLPMFLISNLPVYEVKYFI